MTTHHPLYLEDLSVGDQFTSGEYTLDADKIIAFAREFDPQPFHTDPEAARKTFFQGHAASGWHTAAITMRLLVVSLPLARGMIGAGVDVTWPRPTRPGDTLHVVSTVKAIAPSRSRPDRGMVTLECRTFNQHGEECQHMVSRVLVWRKGAAPA